MTGERKPKMSIDEIEAAARELSGEELEELIDRLAAHQMDAAADIDPAILERARQSMADIKSGRAQAIPAEEVLDMLDRMAT